MSERAGEGYDLLFPVGPGDRQQWIEHIDHIYLTGMPRHLRDGARVYLLQDADVFWSAPVSALVASDARPRTSWITGKHHGPGPTLYLDRAGGRPENIDATTLPTPDGRPWHEGQGFKYVTPGCGAFVRVGPPRAGDIDTEGEQL